MANEGISPKKKKELIAAYEEHGSAGAACATVGLTIYRWNWLIRADEKFRDAINIVRAEKVGQVRNKLWENILSGHPSSIFYYLNNYDPERINDMRQSVADGAGLLPLNQLSKGQLNQFVEKKKSAERKQGK